VTAGQEVDHGISMWDHQQRGCDDLINLYESNIGKTEKYHPCLTSPTGGGKSRMMVYLMRKLQFEYGASTAFLVNRKTLVDQFANTCESFGINYGVIASQRKEVGYDKPHLICASDTLVSRCLNRKSLLLPAADVVFVDEAHLQKSGGKQKIIEMFKEAGSMIVGMTATPVEISHIYDGLVVAGTNSELRKCGAHLPCLVYGPDEPDIRHVKRMASGEFSLAQLGKYVYQIFGRVYDHYQIYNPDRKPTILFAPGVDESVWFMEQFNKCGVSAVHIDGTDIISWENGESTRLSSDPETRRQIFDKVQNGEIKIVTNRFVMREGIDIPGLYHAILACPIGSTKSYIQTVGRVLRNCETLKEDGHVCVARDALVLTDRGYVKIQDVLITDLVWDGVEFVSHDGPTCNGHTEVIEWDGVVATPTHKVLTNDGWKEIAEAKAGAWGLVRSEFGGHPVRVLDHSNPNHKSERRGTGGSGRLQFVRKSLVRAFSQNRKESPKGMQELHQTFRIALPRMDLSTSSAPVEKVQRSEGYHVSSIRWQGNRVSVSGRLVGCDLDSSKSWRRKAGDDSGQDRQRRSLRTRKFEVGNIVGANEKSREFHPKGFKDEKVFGEVSSCEIPEQSSWWIVSGWDVLGRNRETVVEIPVVEVWDIVNAGPRNRFTVNGRIVENCVQDHGGNWWRHGSPNMNRDWESVFNLKESFVSDFRAQQISEGKEPEPICCPNCRAIRMYGPKCHSCGFEHKASTRMVWQVNGELKEVTSSPFPKKYRKDNEDARQKWKSLIISAQRSRSKHPMSFRQAEALFFHDNGYWPARDIPYMPISDSDMFRKVRNLERDELIMEKAVDVLL